MMQLTGNYNLSTGKFRDSQPCFKGYKEFLKGVGTTKKVLFVCNTPYQIITAVQLRITQLKGWSAEIIVTDIISSSFEIYNNIKKLKIFNEVYHLKINQIDWNKNRFTNVDIKKINSVIKDSPLREKFFDTYFFANVGGFDLQLGAYLKFSNKNISFCMFEDGLSSYSKIYKNAIENKCYNPSLLKRLYFRISKPILSCIDKYYVFTPELMCWTASFPVIPIQRISSIDLKTIYYLNMIFDYDNCKDEYDEKIIFFEESYFIEGRKVDDLQLVKCLAEKYGKDNILIKIHPRNPVNRFKDLGYKTNSNISVPWEIIALNKNISNKRLVTITSTALVNTVFLLDTKTMLIFLYKCLDKNNEIYYEMNKVIEKIGKINPNAVLIPNCLDNL